MFEKRGSGAVESFFLSVRKWNIQAFISLLRRAASGAWNLFQSAHSSSDALTLSFLPILKQIPRAHYSPIFEHISQLFTQVILKQWFQTILVAIEWTDGWQNVLFMQEIYLHSSDPPFKCNRWKISSDYNFTNIMQCVHVDWYVMNCRRRRRQC